jgi:hypothetical protein
MNINLSEHLKSPLNIIFLFLLIVAIPLSTIANTADWGMVQRFTKQNELAKKGDVKAMYNVGKFYERGRGVDTDMAKAAEWFQKASAAGHVASQARLGILYFEGRGVKKDHKKALELLNSAAKENSASAQFQLANMYELGAGAPKNLTTAISWYQKADSNGYYLAKSKAEHLQQLLQVIRQNEEKVTPKESAQTETKTAPKTVTKTIPLTALMKTINNGQWLKRKTPVGYLPSMITTCAENTHNSIHCISTSQERNTGFEIVTYNTESTITAKNNTEFNVIYTNNVLEVNSFTAEDGDGEAVAQAPSRIKTGSQGKQHSLNCNLKSKNLISCNKDNSQTFELVNP